MAHFAEINSNNIVLRVVVIDDSVESDGENWCNNFFGGGNWKQTSYNTHGNQHPTGTPFRKNYAGIGHIYDSTRDAFIAPQPFPSWNLVEETCLWEAPIPYPTVPEGSTDIYTWNEDTQAWDLVTE